MENYKITLDEKNNGVSAAEAAYNELKRRAEKALKDREAIAQDAKRIENEARAKSEAQAQRDAFAKKVKDAITAATEHDRLAFEELDAQERNEELRDVIASLSATTALLSEATLLIAQMADEVLTEA